MADVDRTIDIIFGAIDNTGNAFTSVGNSIHSFESNVSSVTGPLAELTTSLLLSETAVLGLAAAYGGYAITQSVKFQNAQIDLQKVLSASDPQIEEFTNTVIELSEQYGISSASILQGIANFKQAGFTAQESALLQKDALDLIIAGDVNATAATEILISSLKGFSAEAAESSRFIEALNNVSNEYATDLGELANGMASISPIANKMGFTFEETTGLITPIIEVFRSGEEAANALKTGLLKLTTDTGPVNEALLTLGVSQHTLTGEMRSGKDIFYDVAEAFKFLDDSQKLVVTTQLVGIEQAGKMVTVFDNLALSQQVTATAMERTGSVTKEVNLRLASTEKQVERVTIVFSNMSKEVGDKLVPSFGASVEGVGALLKSFRDVVSEGGLDPLFNTMTVQGEEFKTFLYSVAEALPEAFEGLEFDGLIDSFGTLKTSIIDLFNGQDITTADGLHNTLQDLVNFITLLTNASAGAISGLKPLFQGIASFLEKLASSDADMQSFIGGIGGIATSIDLVLPLLGFVADAIILVGGAIGLLGAERAVTGLGGIAIVLAGLSPTNVALATAFGAVTFAIDANLTAYNKLAQAENELLATQAHTIETSNKIALKLLEISKATGTTVTSIKELDVAISEGNIKFNEATGVYESTETALRDFDKEVAEVAANSVTAAGTTQEYTDSMKALGFIVDPLTGKLTSVDKALSLAAASSAIAEETSRGYKVELIDGVRVYTQVATGLKDVAQTSNTATQAIGSLTEKQRLASEQSHELEITLEKLASNKLIANMQFKAEIEVANIQAGAAQVVAAYDAIGVSVSSTNDLIGTLFGQDAPDWDRFGFETRDAIANAEDRARALAKSQLALNSAQIDLMRERLAASQRGDANVTIDVQNAEPEMQLLLKSLFEFIAIKANEEGMELLTL